MESLKGFLRAKDAAEVLGVSEGTIRNWSRASKIPTYRHPINSYRLFKREDLLAVGPVREANAPKTVGRATPGPPSWTRPGIGGNSIVVVRRDTPYRPGP